MLLHVLEELGFRVWFRYEKYREEFAHEDVTIAIDETPVGTFVEIEGSEQGIHDMAAALARKPADYVTDSYRGPVREALRAARPAAHRHALRGILTASRRSHPDGRSRHATPATLLRSRETRRARRGRAARAPASSVRRRLGRPRLRAQPSLSARDDHRAGWRRQRSRRPRPVFVRIAGARIGRRAAQGADAAAGRGLLHHQRRHAHKRGLARARRESSRDRRARDHRRHSERPSRPLRRADRRFDGPLPQRRAAPGRACARITSSACRWRTRRRSHGCR